MYPAKCDGWKRQHVILRSESYLSLVQPVEKIFEIYIICKHFSLKTVIAKQNINSLGFFFFFIARIISTKNESIIWNKR